MFSIKRAESKSLKGAKPLCTSKMLLQWLPGSLAPTIKKEAAGRQQTGNEKQSYVWHGVGTESGDDIIS